MKPALRVPAAGLVLGGFELDADTSRYVIKVHRVAVGDTLRLFDPEAAREGEGTVMRARADAVLLDVSDVREVASTALPVTLLQALGKGDKPEQAIRDATVLGASRVVLLDTDCSLSRGWGDDRLKRHRRVAVEAARQSGRANLPEIHGPVAFEAALAEERATRRLVFAWHAEARPVLAALETWVPSESLALLIGPEGGLSESEVTLALDSGFAPVSLGPLVLRTETAATVALGIVRARADVRLRWP